MTEPPFPWAAELTVRVPTPAFAEWVERSLAPEASREVPRARATVRRADPCSVRVAVEARDSGAIRAALNTYLGWVHLALATVAQTEVASGGAREGTGSEGLMSGGR